MKPKTKLQKKVSKLFGQFERKPLSTHHLDRAIEDAFVGCGFHNVDKKNNLFSCGECGHRWKGDFIRDEESPRYSYGRHSMRVKCPYCGKEINVSLTNERVMNSWSYACVVTTFKGFQVFSYWYVKKIRRVGKSCIYHNYGKVTERWVSPEGKVVTFSLSHHMGIYTSQPWAFDSMMSIKKDIFSLRGNNGSLRGNYSDQYDFGGGVYITRLLPELKKAHFRYCKGDFLINTMRKVLTSDRWQTLLELGMDNAFASIDTLGQLKRLWSPLRITIRNHYVISDFNLWVDMIDTLLYLGKDVCNAYYVCPEDLHKAHDQWMDKKLKKDHLIQLEERKKQALLENMDYIKDKGELLDIAIEGKDLRIQPLQSVVEFVEEAEAMHHCVYANSYYKRKTSLILSVRNAKGERLATVEYDLRKGRIVQTMAKCNQVPERKNEIESLIKRNRNKFEIRMQEQEVCT